MPRKLHLYYAVAVAGLLIGAATPSMAQVERKMCNPVLDSAGNPVVRTDKRIVLYSGSTVCPEETAAAPTTVAVTEPVALPHDGTVFFDLDKSELDADQKAALGDIVAALQQHKAGITVAGFADATGTPDHNMWLSGERAKNVCTVLREAGIPDSAFTWAAHGENELAVATDDGVAMRENRRVVVSTSTAGS